MDFATARIGRCCALLPARPHEWDIPGDFIECTNCWKASASDARALRIAGDDGTGHDTRRDRQIEIESDEMELAAEHFLALVEAMPIPGWPSSASSAARAG